MIRQFAPDRTVSAEDIRSIVEVARWTGSARNRQPWRFVEVRDHATIGALAQLGAYAQFITSAPVVLAIAHADDGFSDTSFDAGRITQTLILAAASLGIQSCVATIFPDSHIAAACTLLHLEPSWRPSHVLALGYGANSAVRAGTAAVPRGRLRVEDLLFTLAASEGSN